MLNLFTSFGFFAEPADDRRVLAEFARVLAPGGVLVWHGGSRDGVMARFLQRDWWQTADGTLIAHDPIGKATIATIARTAIDNFTVAGGIGSGIAARVEAAVGALNLNGIVIGHFHADHWIDLAPLRYRFPWGDPAPARPHGWRQPG